MIYQVITWDEQHNCTRYHEVVDAIDYDDAEQVIKHQFPYERLLGTNYVSTNSK